MLFPTKSVTISRKLVQLVKIPPQPPTFQQCLTAIFDAQPESRWSEVLSRRIGPAPNGKYLHWDKLRHLAPPEGLTAEEWWAAIKFARHSSRRALPLRDTDGGAFHYSTPDHILRLLHLIDQNASGQVALPEEITTPHTRDRYVQTSLIEEAITSSQIEGAATTREQAKEMIRFGRKPIDVGERMIFNNYRAMQFITELQGEPLTPALVFEIHRIITQGTLPAEAQPPYLRVAGDNIGVWDNRDNTLLHAPPDAAEISGRLAGMCDFANRDDADTFLHPVLKAIILHFWLAYDHPFIDGNGRTARALFYWCMLRRGYWLAEFLSISSILRKAPSAYGRSFLYAETDENDLTYFIDAQLDVIHRSIQALHKYLARKVEEVRETERLLNASATLNHRQLALLSHSLRHPGASYTIASHRKSHQVTYQTARTDLLALAANGMLIQGARGNAFVFSPAPNLRGRLQGVP